MSEPRSKCKIEAETYDDLNHPWVREGVGGELGVGLHLLELELETRVGEKRGRLGVGSEL